MATHTKFLVEFTSITLAAVLALVYPTSGFALGMILVMGTRFALLGERADVWSARWLALVTGIALYWLATGVPFKWVVDLSRPAHPSTAFGNRPFWAWINLVIGTWLILTWRLHHKHRLANPKIV